MNGVGESPIKNKTEQTPQYKKNHNTTTKIHSTKPTIKTKSTTHEGGEEDRGLNRKFKRGVKDKGIGHWVNGVEEENGEEPE